MRVHLNRPLVLQTPTRVADGAGGFVLAWVSEGVLWGEVVAGAGSEADIGAQVRRQAAVRRRSGGGQAASGGLGRRDHPSGGGGRACAVQLPGHPSGEPRMAAGLDREVWQFPVVLLADVRSVGVQGDGRTYGHPVVLRPVSSEDAMTADWSRLPYDLLARISTRITNEVPEVNRVTLDITSKPPGTIEWE